MYVGKTVFSLFPSINPAQEPLASLAYVLRQLVGFEILLGGILLTKFKIVGRILDSVFYLCSEKRDLPSKSYSVNEL